ncbi:MAG: glycosyltransferase [Myxococcales bacterium]|nr:glycosyltransferase [Myxococcales bacterium]
MTPALSVVIPWCNRDELATTLAHNRARFAAGHAVVIVVNCGGRRRALAQQLATANVAGLRVLHIPVRRFNKSLALNLGAWAASAPRLLQLDADILLDDDTMVVQAPALLARPGFVNVERVHESAAARSERPSQLLHIAHVIELETADGRRAHIETNRYRLTDRSRSAPGLVLLRRADFLAVGGMTSDLEGWGWEDLDLLVRLQLQLGLRQRLAGAVIHLSHGDASRDTRGRSRIVTEADNYQRCLAHYALGRLIGTYRADVARWSTRLERT